MKRLDAELKGKAQIERENREIYLEQIKLKSEEQRKTVLESIKTAGNVIGTGITTLLENPNKILMAVRRKRNERERKQQIAFFLLLHRPVELHC